MEVDEIREASVELAELRPSQPCAHIAAVIYQSSPAACLDVLRRNFPPPDPTWLATLQADDDFVFLVRALAVRSFGSSNSDCAKYLPSGARPDDHRMKKVSLWFRKLSVPVGVIAPTLRPTAGQLALSASRHAVHVGAVRWRTWLPVAGVIMSAMLVSVLLLYHSEQTLAQHSLLLADLTLDMHSVDDATVAPPDTLIRLSARRLSVDRKQPIADPDFGLTFPDAAHVVRRESDERRAGACLGIAEEKRRRYLLIHPCTHACAHAHTMFLMFDVSCLCCCNLRRRPWPTWPPLHTLYPPLQSYTAPIHRVLPVARFVIVMHALNVACGSVCSNVHH
jgi:hypothetical protein